MVASWALASVRGKSWGALVSASNIVNRLSIRLVPEEWQGGREESES